MQIPTDLTDWERELIRMLALHGTVAGTARALYTSERTVLRHLRALFAKTDTAGADDLVAVALSRGWLDDADRLAGLNALADRCRARYGDTPALTIARRGALAADLDRYQARRGTPYKPNRARADHERTAA